MTDANRKAICPYCSRTALSSRSDLAFFESRDEGSEAATKMCKCGTHLNAHTGKPWGRPNVVDAGKCQGFEARGAYEFDSFYCGCRGWD